MSRIVTFLTLASLSTTAHAAIILVDTGFANTNTSGDGTASLSKVAAALPNTGFLYTHSYDAGASFDMLVVTVSREAGIAGTFSVSYGGVGMNLATGGLTGSGVSIFYLKTTATTGNIVLDFTNFGTNGVGIGIAAIKSDNGDPIGLYDADSISGGTNTSGITTINIDTADNSFTMWAVDTNLGTFDNLTPNQIVKNTDIGSNGYAAAYELVTTGQNGDTYSYNFTGAVPSTQAARSIAAANFVVVPEPGAALLGGFGLLCLLRRRR
jgi:hypothetical protein